VRTRTTKIKRQKSLRQFSVIYFSIFSFKGQQKIFLFFTMTGMFTSLNASASSSGPSTNPVPPLPSLFNPAKLKDLSTTRLTDSNFRAWRNIVQSEFDYYGIEGVINGKLALVGHVTIPLLMPLFISLSSSLASSFRFIHLCFR